MKRDRLETLVSAFGRKTLVTACTRCATTSLVLGLVLSAPVLPGDGAPARPAEPPRAAV